MARTPKKSIYEQIEQITTEIAETEQLLTSLKDQKKQLEKDRDELEMKQLFARMKEQNLSFQEAMDALTSNKTE